MKIVASCNEQMTARPRSGQLRQPEEERVLTSRPRWPADIHERLHAASVNARELGDWSVALRERAIIARLSSRPRGHFARVVGTLRGLAVTGLVRKDGGLAGHPELVKEACRILDLSGLTFIDASGLQAIVNAKQHIEAEGNKFRVRGAVGIVRRIFDVTSLSPWLED
jgi:ABC-type transporter Mla MlaB component